MKIISDDESVCICIKNSENEWVDSFIDIWVDNEGDIPSPFKSVEDAKLFAEMIVKLLGVVYNDIE